MVKEHERMPGKLYVIDFESIMHPPYRWGNLGLPIWVPQSLAIEMPLTNSPEESIAWLAAKAAHSRGARLFKSIMTDLTPYPKNEKLEKMIRSKKGLKKIANSNRIKPKPGRTLTAYKSTKPGTRNTPADSQQVSYLRVAKSKEIINSPMDAKCQEMDDAATKLLKEAGYFD